MESVFALIVLIVIITYWVIRAYHWKKKFIAVDLILDNRIHDIGELNKEKDLYKGEYEKQKSTNWDLRDENKKLQEQVSMLVTQINSVGVRRNKKGQFESID